MEYVATVVDFCKDFQFDSFVYPDLYDSMLINCLLMFSKFLDQVPIANVDFTCFCPYCSL